MGVSKGVMSERNNTSDLHDRIVTLVCVAALLFSARYAADIVVPFLLALFIAVVALDPIDWLKKRGLPSAVAVGVVILVVVGFECSGCSDAGGNGRAI